VSVPLRGPGPGLALAANVTGPDPVPDAPPLIVSQSGLFEDAVQAQPEEVVTPTLPDPPFAATVWLVGMIENVQAAC
jgi:hypothetical protein